MKTWPRCGCIAAGMEEEGKSASSIHAHAGGRTTGPSRLHGENAPEGAFCLNLDKASKP